ALIGALAYRLLAPSVKQAVKDKAELDSAREELTSYKVSVNEHFNKTSELVNDLTQNYVKVYQHLAEGAHTLGDSKTFNNLLEQHPGKVSLTVAGDSPAPDPVVEDTIVEAAAPLKPPSDFAESVSDEPAAEVEAANDSSETAAAASSDEPDSPPETPEPGFSADAQDASATTDETETTADAGSAMPEDKDKPETGRTVH
ncbi:MAG: YhcB family protein, partial [Gammaproteobacteria bacterium]|nr:YhcB family protein [Gammaproteobacteria bacterium]